jgi:hypothetical protein
MHHESNVVKLQNSFASVKDTGDFFYEKKRRFFSQRKILRRAAWFTACRGKAISLNIRLDFVDTNEGRP